MTGPAPTLPRPIRLKRAYAQATEDDGTRVLIDRLWPRGVSRDRAAIDIWMKEIAPSDELRRWYGHDPDLQDEFKRRYFAELDANPAPVERLAKIASQGPLTLVYATKREEGSNAWALRGYLQGRG